MQKTQSSPKDNTANAWTKLLHLDWVSLHRTHECEILETTLNVKKAMWRQYKLPAARGGTAVRNKFHCSVLKEILWFFTPLNYIQTFKIQFFFFQECWTCTFTPYTYIEKSPWTESDTADLAISNIKRCHNIEKKKKAIIEKSPKKKRVVLYVFHCLLTKRYGKISAKNFFFFYKVSNNSCVKFMSNV